MTSCIRVSVCTGCAHERCSQSNHLSHTLVASFCLPTCEELGSCAFAVEPARPGGGSVADWLLRCKFASASPVANCPVPPGPEAAAPDGDWAPMFAMRADKLGLSKDAARREKRSRGVRCVGVEGCDRGTPARFAEVDADVRGRKDASCVCSMSQHDGRQHVRLPLRDPQAVPTAPTVTQPSGALTLLRLKDRKPEVRGL